MTELELYTLTIILAEKTHQYALVLCVLSQNLYILLRIAVAQSYYYSQH